MHEANSVETSTHGSISTRIGVSGVTREPGGGLCLAIFPEVGTFVGIGGAGVLWGSLPDGVEFTC